MSTTKTLAICSVHVNRNYMKYLEKRSFNMANKKKNEYGKMTIKELASLGKTFPVKYAGFKKVVGARGSFMSAYFLIQTGDTENDCVWVNTPREASAFKAIGAMTATINGNPVNITGIEITQSNSYYDFKYELTERVFEEMPEELMVATSGDWTPID